QGIGPAWAIRCRVRTRARSVAKLSEVLRGLAAPRGADLTDGQLLERFVASREQAAFENLVRRHGPMVLGVCLRVLGRHADAEDAFQATFLVLARKAASVRPREHVAGFLHGVARRTALKARCEALRLRSRERHLEQLPEPRARDQGDPELLARIDEEVERLPQRYRMALLLCAIQGRSYKDAARQLGCPEGTVASWLCRARQMLAARLSRRGVEVPAHVTTAPLAWGATQAVSAALVESTADQACLFAAGGVESSAAALAEGVLKAMIVSKLKVWAAVLLALVVVTGAACSLWALEQRRPDVPPAPVARPLP